MPQIGNLGIRMAWQFYVIDDAGNTHALPSEPVQISEPSEAAVVAAYRRWEAERDQHRANLAAQMQQAAAAPPRAERRRAARAAVKEATAATAPANGKHSDTAQQPVGVEE